MERVSNSINFTYFLTTSFIWKLLKTEHQEIGLVCWRHTARIRLLHPIHLYLIFEKSSLKSQVRQIGLLTWKKSISKLIFTGYTGCKNLVWKWLKIQFVKLDFPTWFFKKQVQMDRTSNSALNANAEIQVFNGI